MCAQPGLMQMSHEQIKVIEFLQQNVRESAVCDYDPECVAQTHSPVFWVSSQMALSVFQTANADGIQIQSCSSESDRGLAVKGRRRKIFYIFICVLFDHTGLK